MSLINVVIKNAGKSYPLEIDTNEPGETFKLQIYSVTDIPPEKQKVILKGGVLKDDSDLTTFKIKEGQSIMVLGTPESKVVDVNKADVEKTLGFVEDNKSGDFVVNSNEPLGLVNLGNTCYLNSSLQALFKVDEIKNDLTKFQKGTGSSADQQLIFDLKALFNRLETEKSKGKAITPLNFLSSMRANFPQFRERGNDGFYKQQDAEEAFSQILLTLIHKFPDLENCFKIGFKTETKCIEDPNDVPVIGYDESNKLSCHISIHTNFLKNALIDNLKETLEKNNANLGRNANYDIVKKITRLPKYLTVNYVRFYWKRDTGKKAKILRKVQFPFELDVSDLLDEDFKQSRSKLRDAIHKVEKSNEEEQRDFKKLKLSDGKKTPEKEKELISKLNENYLGVMDDDAKSLIAKGENPSSLYELISVVAHQGSSADSGHYQCFNKDTNDLSGDTWYKYNDDKITTVSRDKIESLAGGGESDSALILIYKAVGLN